MARLSRTRVRPASAMHGLRWWLRCALALWVGIAAMGPAMAQGAFPSKPVRLVVPYTAGGASDALARYIGVKLGEIWGQQVVVENRPGGGTAIGALAVAHAPPDGYTLLLVNNTHVINQLLMPNLPYDAFKDFTPVTTLATSPYLFLLNPGVPAHNLQEFIALAKSKPGKLNFGTGGIGGLTHLAGELFNSMAGVKISMIHYKGAAPVTNALLSGEIDAYLDTPATTLQFVQTGRLKTIGITGAKRLASLPQVPTVAEAGLPGFDVTLTFGFLGPAGLPPAIVRKLTADINRVLAMPDVDEKLSGLGVTPYPTDSADFTRWLKAEYDKYERVIQTAHIKIE
jgi:tripartite-type tricarboxylate transporter receptor subunit TctC